MNSPIELKDLAAEALDGLRQVEKNGRTVWMIRGMAPHWVWALADDASPDCVLDDWRLRFIANSLALLAEGEDAGALEASPYTSELLHWLTDGNSRLHYLDQAVQDFGLGEDTPADERLKWGQLVEINEVLELVIASLTERLNSTLYVEVTPGAAPESFEVEGSRSVRARFDKGIHITDGVMERAVSEDDFYTLVGRQLNHPSKDQARYAVALALLDAPHQAAGRESL